MGMPLTCSRCGYVALPKGVRIVPTRNASSASCVTEQIPNKQTEVQRSYYNVSQHQLKQQDAL
jgi:hypothetical protein